jgi:ATP-dependent phosphoenolpyruvate carboxykinase
MSRFSREQVADIIRAKIDAFGEDAWFINNGWCQSFAIGVARTLGPDAKVVNSLTQYRDGTFPGHSWIEYEGLHFDAETPDGVSNPREMQYHRRLRAIADSPEEKNEEEAVFEALGHEPIY